MKIFAGTSGYSYAAWKGPFYPEKLSAAKMLAYYAERLPTVEINNTFYRMPKTDMLAKWAEKTPPGFRFVLKAPAQITHKTRLKEGAAESTHHLWTMSEGLGDRRGPILFQLPPHLKCDLSRLTNFLGALPAGIEAAFEFRHASWDTDEVDAALAEAGCARCIADIDPQKPPRVSSTTDWGYVRLRRESYSDEELSRWRDRLLAQPWRRAFVFFKHEEEGIAPKLATAFLALCQTQAQGAAE